jgi:signal transduction histidine kinase
MSVLLIGLALLAILVNFALQDFLIRQKEAAMFVQADEIIDMLQNSSLSLDTQFQKIETDYKRISNTRMDLVLPDETPFPPQNTKALRRLLRKSEMKDPLLLEKVLAGERVDRKGPFKKTDDQVLLSVGVPILKGGQVIGALFLHTPFQEIQMRDVTRLIVIVALIIAVPAALVLYWISRQISRPLVRMNQAAAAIGKGHFSERITVSGSDEVGQLSVTFNQMAEQLENLETMRKELIANVSHELRTPLTSVRGFVQGILEGIVPPDQQKRYLEFMYQELSRLSTLLNTMLDLSAIESGRITLTKRIIRWFSLVDTVGDSVRLRMEEKNIQFENIEPEDGQLTVWGDPERLKQVLFNLLDNAIRHTPEGGSITIQSTAVGDYVEVCISDTGSGIDPDKLPYVWERFYTEEASRLSRRERSGLGLTITKQLVELMGGTINVESAIGSGTTFILLLPNGKQANPD